MATTTNYGWTTPDNTDLVKDGALAIRTLGSSVDTTTKALNPSTTLGDIEYRSATANINTRLGIGSTGQVLTVSGGVPTWANATGGGKVLQVVNFTSTASGGTSTSTFVDSSLTATITPAATTSKILVFVNINVQKDSGANSYGGQRLLRGATVIASMGTQDGYTANGDANNIGNTGITYLDSPSTTSATTYKVQINSFGNNGSIAYGSGGARSSITLMEIGA
jgi:hypothetical protein